MSEDAPRTLARLVAKKLLEEQLVPPATAEADYDLAIDKVRRRAPALQAQVARNRARVESRYTDLEAQPAGRRATVFRNSSPTMLLALAYDLMRRSRALRFDDAARSLKLAELALEAVEWVARTDLLSMHSVDDLLGEALCYLGNARRVNSDIPGADRALAAAERHLDRGTGDRSLRADCLSFQASLRFAQGRSCDAAELQDREIALRRLLRNKDRLGTALIDRGLLACWEGDLRLANRIIREGTELVSSYRPMYMGLLYLAEAHARADEGVDAWKLLCTADLVGGLFESGALELRHRWTKAITYRALGQPARGERILRAVRDDLINRSLPLTAAIATIDLIAILAAQGKSEELMVLAEEAYATFSAERLERRALAVFPVLVRAAQTRRLSEELAVRAANFLFRLQHNRALRFEAGQSL